MPEPPDTTDALDALDAQITQHLDGQIDADDFASLNDRLAGDTDAIDRLLAASACHVALAERAEHRGIDSVIRDTQVEHTARTRRWRIGTTAAAIAAGLAVAATLWFTRPTAVEPAALSPPASPIVTDDPADGITDSAGPDMPRIDLTQEIFASSTDIEPSEPVSDPTPDAPFLAVLTTAPAEAHVAVNWPILGGTLESFPRRPASVSPIDDLNPTLRFTP